jgi:hypothetical protein
LRNEITLNDFLWSFSTEIAVHGASSATIGAFAVTGGFIGSIIPFVGTGIGSVIGSLIGVLVSDKVVEPFMISQLQKNLVLRDIDKKIDLKMYKESLTKYNIAEKTSVETIKKLRRILQSGISSR